MLSRLGLVSAPTAYYAYNNFFAQCDAPAPSPPPAGQPPKPLNEDDKNMQELEQIFKDNPYAAADPEEMERMLQSRNKKKTLRPPQFAKLMIPVKMLTTCEALDGLRFEMSMGLTEKFQLGGSWNFSNSKPSNFSLTTMFSPNMNPYSDTGMNFINCKKDVGGKMEFVSNYHLSNSLTLKAEGFFPNENVDSSHISYEIMKEFDDWHISGKAGGGSYSISMMQMFNMGQMVTKEGPASKNLACGFEAMWHPQMRDFIFNYGFKYVLGNHTVLAQYIPIAKKDAFTLAYTNRASNKLNLFGEFRGSPEGFSESTLGFKLRFNSGVVTGTMNSHLKMTSSIQMMMDAMLMTMLNTTMDLLRPEKPVTFGVAISFGGGM